MFVNEEREGIRHELSADPVDPEQDAQLAVDESFAERQGGDVERLTKQDDPIEDDKDKNYYIKEFKKRKFSKNIKARNLKQLIKKILLKINVKLYLKIR